MKKSKFTDSQIMDALKRVEAGLSVSEISRELGNSSATFYKWRAKFGGMDVSMIARLKELTAENGRSLRLFSVVNYSNREALGIEVDLSLPTERVIRAMNQIIEWRGKYKAIRCDNGPEYTSGKLIA